MMIELIFFISLISFSFVLEGNLAPQVPDAQSFEEQEIDDRYGDLLSCEYPVLCIIFIFLSLLFLTTQTNQ